MTQMVSPCGVGMSYLVVWLINQEGWVTGPGALLLALIPEWISNHLSSKVCDEIRYPFPNFNGGAIDFWELISIFIPHYIKDVITYPS